MSEQFLCTCCIPVTTLEEHLPSARDPRFDAARVIAEEYSVLTLRHRVVVVTRRCTCYLAVQPRMSAQVIPERGWSTKAETGIRVPACAASQILHPSRTVTRRLLISPWCERGC